MAKRFQHLIGDDGLFQGDNLTIEITCTDEDDNAFDLTDADTLVFTLYDMLEETLILTKDLGDGVSIGGAGNSVASVDIDPADSEITPGMYTFFLTATATDYTQTLSTGNLEIADHGRITG